GEPCDVVVPPAAHLDLEVAQAICADAVREGLREAVAQPGIRGDVCRGDGIEQSNGVADGEGLGRRRRRPALEVALLELPGYGAWTELEEIVAAEAEGRGRGRPGGGAGGRGGARSKSEEPKEMVRGLSCRVGPSRRHSAKASSQIWKTVRGTWAASR